MESSQQFRVKRSKYALLESRLTRSIDDLETWQGIFDPSWYLIISAAIPQIDAELARYAPTPMKTAIWPSYSLRDTLKRPDPENTPIWLKEEGIADLDVSDIALSSVRLAKRPGNRDLILETIPSLAAIDPTVQTKDIRDLARKLLVADPVTFGLLNCKGVIKEEDPQTKIPISFTFVFRMPDKHSDPLSLRSMLLSDNFEDSLSDRFEVASQLAKSVCNMHTFGFVHKNVRPENILMLKGRDSEVRRAYLVGFEHFRSAEGATAGLGDTAWERNLYRHPTRQGNRPEKAYVMQHDIYS